MMVADDTGTGDFSKKETIFGIASGVTFIGFWGIAIDVALRSYIYQANVYFHTGYELWVFSAIFVIGLLAMGISSLKRVGSRR